MAELLLINGTSSTGKTTLARALQDHWSTPMIYLGLDAWVTSTLAEKYWEPATTLDAIKTDPFVRQGTHFLAPNSPDNPSPWPQIASGLVSDTVVFMLHDTAFAFLAKGMSVVLDTVFLKAAWRDDFLTKAEQQACCLIQMTASEEILTMREQARGNRMENVFRSLLPIVHQGIHYDLSLDTGILSTEEAVALVLTYVHTERRAVS